jgi:hypothetical protein
MPREYRRAPRAERRASSIDGELTIEAMLVRVSVRGVCGVSTAAVNEYVQMLLDGVSRQRATVVPAPSIDAALEDECEQHPSDCTDPCCVDEDDLDDVHAYCADEGHQVLVDARGFYGVGAW